jgi:Rieske Fe-S protein
VTRRHLLAALLAAAGATLAAVGAGLGLARRRRDRATRVTLALPAADGPSFHDEVILVRSGDRVTALSSRCPHLGCRIDRAPQGQLVCPCHGSRFDLTGHRLAGPADADLRPLSIARHDADEKVDVDLT